MDSLPNGGLLNQKNMVLIGVAIFIIIVSALVIYNVFYLSVVNQVRQFGQLRTVGMTQQQTKKIIRYERKFLCRIGVPIGLLIGGLAGYLLQPDGWDWIAAVVWGIIISVIINFVVKVSLNRPTKIALSISPILSSKYMMERFDCKVTNKEKRKLSSLGLAIISITSHWKSILVSVLSLGLAFIKSYAAICLEGCVILLACIIFSQFASSPPVVTEGLAPATVVWNYIGELVFNMLVLVGSIKMSDRIIRELMGLG